MATWTTPRDWSAGETLTAALLNTHLRDNLKALSPVGSLTYVVQAATSVETLIEGAWLECNGVAVNRTTYSELNTKLSALSYPFGSGDGSTTFNLPDLRGRSLVAMAASGHTDVNGIGDSDGVGTVASRTPKVPTHTHTVSGTTGSESAHTHGAGSYQVTVPEPTVFVTGGGANAADGGTYSVAGTSGAGSSHSHSAGSLAAGSGGSHPGSFLVAGVYAIKAKS